MWMVADPHLERRGSIFMPRFGLLFCFFGLFCFSPVFAQIPSTDELVFKILRNGEDFGTHKMLFHQNNEEIRVSVDIQMTYDFGPFTLFRYEHQNEEVWKNGRLESLSARTYDDGKELYVEATAQGQEITVTGSNGAFSAPKDLMSTTYWKRDMLEAASLLNTQYGRVHNIKVTKEGTLTKEIAGDFYKVEKLNFTDLYDGKKAVFYYEINTQQWVGLEFSIRGSNLEYIRQTPLPKKYALK